MNALFKGNCATLTMIQQETVMLPSISENSGQSGSVFGQDDYKVDRIEAQVAV